MNWKDITKEDGMYSGIVAVPIFFSGFYSG